MKKTITLLFILSFVVFNINAQDRVLITLETFGNIVFGTNEHGADTNFDGTIDIEVPSDDPGYARHFDYDFIQEITDLGYSGFTSKNGNTVSFSSDSSIQMNTYVGTDNQPWDNASGSVKLHITPDYRYNGSWDSAGIQGIDLTKYGGTINSISVEFGVAKRQHEPATANAWGLIVEVSADGAKVELDTSVLPTPLEVTIWHYAQMDVPGDMSAVNTLDVGFYCLDKNQFGIDDISVIGQGTNVPILDEITVTGASNIDVEGGTAAYDVNVVADPAAIDSTVSWSVVEGTGCASIDPETGVLTAEGNGTVTVVATANDGGGAEGTLEVTLSNQTALVESITVTSDGTSITTGGGTMQMTATVVPHCANDLSVTWSVDNTDLAEIDPSTGLLTAKANVAGSVSVTATANDASGVSGSKNILISTETGIIDINNSEISLYPNPANNTLDLSNASSVELVEVLGINGAAVISIRNDFNNNISLDVSALVSGMYFIKLQAVDGTIYMSKFIKE